MYEIFAELLKKHNVTRYQVSKATGVPQSSLSDWSKGKSKPKYDNMKKIADYFGVSVDYLLGNEEKEKPATGEGNGLEDLLKDQFIAFYGEVKNSLDETDLEDLKTFMRMKAEIKKNREKK